MIILGLESSCDETGVAIVRDGREILSNQVSSQIELHAPFGGVVPEIASRAHLKTIEPLTQAALAEARVRWEEIDGIAVTQGPGLIGALLVGAAFAKGLSLALGKPLIPVDHVEAHVHGALLGVLPSGGQGLRSGAEGGDNLNSRGPSAFPALSLVVSGGHTNLYYMTSPTHFELLGFSLDDACGECFDKVGKLLHLGYPAGPTIEKLSRNIDLERAQKNWSMPHMASGSSQDPIRFSYSGLKTFMAQTVQKQQKKIAADPVGWEADRRDLCAAFQEEALGQIVRKTKKALTLRPEAKSILVAGGVAANQRLRHLMNQHTDRPCFYPPLSACSDNGAMIATYGYHIYKEAQNIQRESAAVRQDFMDHRWESYSRYAFHK